MPLSNSFFSKPVQYVQSVSVTGSCFPVVEPSVIPAVLLLSPMHPAASNSPDAAMAINARDLLIWILPRRDSPLLAPANAAVASAFRRMTVETSANDCQPRAPCLGIHVDLCKRFLSADGSGTRKGSHRGGPRAAGTASA